MSEETRKNLVALAIVFVPLLLIAVFAFRPAPILGVSERELSDDLTREYPNLGSLDRVDCTERSDDRYECAAGAGRKERRFVVDVGWTGCWKSTGRLAVNGCVTLFDVLDERPNDVGYTAD